MTAPNIHAIFRAGSVRRWHANPDLCHTVDRVDGHAARVARIILALHPSPSINLIAAALQHDDGEIATGDVPGPIKRANPAFSEMLDGLEAAARQDAWGERLADNLSYGERKWLTFADHLDAYQWARDNRPDVLDGDGWPEAWARLVSMAEALGASLETLHRGRG